MLITWGLLFSPRLRKSIFLGTKKSGGEVGSCYLLGTYYVFERLPLYYRARASQNLWGR